MSKPLSDKQKRIVEEMFDSYCKKVLKCTAINYDKKYNYIAEHETLMSDLPENLFSLSQSDSYFQQTHFFEVSTGEIIVVKGDDIARMITLLPIVKREIILLSYFTNMTDSEIGRKLNIVKRTVQYQRTAALKQLKKILEEQK